MSWQSGLELAITTPTATPAIDARMNPARNSSRLTAMSVGNAPLCHRLTALAITTLSGAKKSGLLRNVRPAISQMAAAATNERMLRRTPGSTRKGRAVFCSRSGGATPWATFSMITVLREKYAVSFDDGDFFVLDRVAGERFALDVDAIVEARPALRLRTDAQQHEIFIARADEPVEAAGRDDDAFVLAQHADLLFHAQMERGFTGEDHEEMLFFGMRVERVLAALGVHFDGRDQVGRFREQVHRTALLE